MIESIAQIPLGRVLKKSDDWISIDSNQRYRQVTVKLWGQGAVLRNEVFGAEIAAARRLQVHEGQLIISRIDARNGAVGLVPASLEGAVVSNDFPAFNIDTSRLYPRYLGWLSKTRNFVDLCRSASEGTTNRVRLQEDRFLGMTIPLPPLDEQHRIVARIEELAAKIEEARGLRRTAVDEIKLIIDSELDSIFGSLGESTQQIEIGKVNGFVTSGPRGWGDYYDEDGDRRLIEAWT